MASIPALDDPNQPVIYIPFTPNEEESCPPPSPFAHRDLPGGHDLRLAAYETTWGNCLSRVQNIIHSLYAPVADKVLDEVRKAHEDVLPGLPYPEIPLICVVAPSASPTFLNDITNRLETSNHLITHLWPSDCTNIMSAMKTIIGGFLDREMDGGLKPPRRNPGTSLASYDINILAAWYDSLGNRPRLVIIIHDFEQIEPSVIQDVFEICSLHIASLPLTFILSLSSPTSYSHLHAAYSRRILTLLCIKTFSLPEGEAVLEEILLKTFFDPSYVTPLVPGPPILEFIVDYFTRHNSSLDTLLTILQLMHMKHFSDPLTILSHDTDLGAPRADLVVQKLTDPSSFGFLDSLFTRLQYSVSKDSPDRWRAQNIPDLISSVDAARSEFHVRAGKMRVGFRLLLTVQAWIKVQGHKPFADTPLTVIEMMKRTMRGGMKREVKWLGSLIRKLAPQSLGGFLDELSMFFTIVDEDEEWLQRQKRDAQGKIGSLSDLLATPGDEETVSRELGAWIVTFLTEAIVPLDENCVLWDVWYTGMTQFPSELINPNVRASVVSGLLDPFAYLSPPLDNEPAQGMRMERDICELPDTSILFKRYLECGKLINVWDWFETFALVCEGKRERERGKGKGKTTSTDGKSPRSPKKSRTTPRKSKSPTKDKSKGKERALPLDSDGEGQEQDEESWKLEVQARFMRALHELDYIGFIKHTGRKRDHVVRTVWEGEG